MEYSGTSVLGILDVSNPLKPNLLCWLSPADGGRFGQSAGKLMFWAGDKLEIADLATGAVVQTDQLAARPFSGAFSADGSMFAYRSGDDNVGVTTHLHRHGADQILYAEAPIGGHGGPSYGPLNQLAFSADGSMLLDFYEFRPAGGPPRLIVFRTADGSIAFQSPGAAAGGVWSGARTTAYFYVWAAEPPAGELDSLDASGRQQTLAGNLNGVYWPAMSPDSAGIVFDTYDSAGQPHLWRFALATNTAVQLSPAAGSLPVFVSSSVVWFDKKIPCSCGPGGLSQPNGEVLAYDLVKGGTSTVDMTYTVPGIGAPQASTREVIDSLP